MMTSSTPSSPPEFAFSKAQRLLNKKDYSRVFDNAPIRASHQNFLVLCRPNDLGYPRIGLVIAKKHVRTAVGRNLVKRVARESFRLQQHKLPAIDAIVLARKGADTLSSTQLRQTYNGLWKRIIKRAKSAAQ